MSNFDEAFDEVIGLEGGYVNDPDDAGGETKWGISKRSYPSWDIKALTKEDAKQIYWRDYWNPLLLARVTDDKISTEIFEQAVNMGLYYASRHAQEAVNLVDPGASLVVDGTIGPKTLAALNGLGQRRRPVWLKVMNGLQFARYLEIVRDNPSQKKFFVGWLRRVNV